MRIPFLLLLVVPAASAGSLGAAESTEGCRALVARLERLEPAGDYAFALGEMDRDTAGGHVQGVQCAAMGRGEDVACFFTHDTAGELARDQPWLYSMMLRADGSAASATRTRLPSTCSGRECEPPRFNHAGGFQLTDGLVAVGLERGPHRSQVRFVDVSDPMRPELLPSAIHRPPVAGQSRSAGAVGLARIGDALLVAVGNWDSQTVDLYRTSERDLRTGRAPALLRALRLERESYQSVQLLLEGPDLCLIGLYTRYLWTGLGRDRLDVFRLRIGSDDAVDLHDCGSVSVDLGGFGWSNTRLIYAGGVGRVGDRLEVWSMRRNLDVPVIRVLRVEE